MSQQNPYSAPQTTGQPAGGIIAPLVQQLIPWQEPLRSQILNVAKHQRWLNVHILIAIVGGIFYGVFGQSPNPRPGASGLTPVGLLLAAVLVMNYALLIYHIYNMVASLGDSALIAVLASLIPLLGILLLLFYSSKATTFLRQFGIAVGLLGASPKVVAWQLSQAEQAANPAAYQNPAQQRSVPQISLPQALPMAQAMPVAAPARPASPAAAAPAKPAQLPMGKPLVQTPAPPAATGQLPVARPLPPVQPKPPQPPKA